MLRLIDNILLGTAKHNDDFIGLRVLNDDIIYIGKAKGPSYIDILLSGVSPLVLTNALADGLNYLKLFGGTEQRNLPDGYTQVEYLQSSGTQYIDLGKISSDDIIDVKFEWTQVSNNYLLGSLEDGSNWQAGKMLGVTYYSTNGRAFYNRGTTASGATGAATSFNITANTEYTIHWQPSSNQITVNGTQYTGAVGNNNQTTDVFETANNLYLFCANHGGVAGSFDYVKMRKFSIVGKRNLIPCRRNSDNVLGMYDTVTGNFLTNSGTGTFTAGANVTVPSPTTPMDIVCNNGVVKLTPNLLDRSKETQGKYINKNTGSIDSTSSPWAVSDYIPVVAGSKITISGITFSSSAAGYNYYNAQKALVSTISYETGTHTYTVPDNASYIMICYRYDPDANVRINVGDSANAIYADGTVETVQITGKNLFDGQWQQGVYNTTGGGYTPGVTNRICNVNTIPVKPSTNYTVSCPSYDLANGMRWLFYDKNKNFISAITNGVTTITTPSNARYINFYVANNLTVSTAPDLQIEEGSTATIYEPYYNGGSATAEMLLKIGTYKDEQSVLDGNVTKNVGIKVLDGTETCAIISKMFRVSLSLPVEKQTGWQSRRICTHGLCGGASASNRLIEVDTNAVWFGGGFVTDMGWTTADIGKRYLADQYNAGTPVIIIYPLATSTTETVTAQPLTVQTGTNIVAITQASMDGLTMEVSYMAGVTVTITEVENAQLSNNVEVTING